VLNALSVEALFFFIVFTFIFSFPFNGRQAAQSFYFFIIIFFIHLALTSHTVYCAAAYVPACIHGHFIIYYDYMQVIMPLCILLRLFSCRVSAIDGKKETTKKRRRG
jgi:hypothetical protein